VFDSVDHLIHTLVSAFSEVVADSNASSNAYWTATSQSLLLAEVIYSIHLLKGIIYSINGQGGLFRVEWASGQFRIVLLVGECDLHARQARFKRFT